MSDIRQLERNLPLVLIRPEQINGCETSLPGHQPLPTAGGES